MNIFFGGHSYDPGHPRAPSGHAWAPTKHPKNLQKYHAIFEKKKVTKNLPKTKFDKKQKIATTAAADLFETD